jgi:hypothetical protein
MIRGGINGPQSVLPDFRCIISDQETNDYKQVTYGSMTEEEYRILPAIKGRVQCLPDKKEPLENCGFCIHCREFGTEGKFVKSPSLAYCSRCPVTGKVDLTKVTAVKCADRQGEGFHSITSIIS